MDSFDPTKLREVTDSSGMVLVHVPMLKCWLPKQLVMEIAQRPRAMTDREYLMRELRNLRGISMRDKIMSDMNW